MRTNPTTIIALSSAVYLGFNLAACSNSPSDAASSRYGQAGYFLSDSRDQLANCRKTVEKTSDLDQAFLAESCQYAVGSRSEIEQAIEVWRETSKSEKRAWFEKHPYRHQEMLDAVRHFEYLAPSIADWERFTAGQD